MSKTTNTENSSWFDPGFTADDHNGHKGYGSTAEHAQQALEQAQEHDVSYAEHKSITGLIIDGKK